MAYAAIHNHILNGHPFVDICDELSAPAGSTNIRGKGCYPKDFKFTGWHPLCRCHAVSILKTDEEIDEDIQRILDGEPLDGKSVNRVNDVPKDFKQWLKDNGERIKKANSQPYFLRDNEKYVRIVTRNPIDVAKERHSSRTPEQIRMIKLQAWDRQLQLNMPQLTKAERKAISENWLLLEQRLGIKKGPMMTIEEADMQAANPKFRNGRAFKENCQTCSPAFMLRLWGFNVTAKGNFTGSLSEKLSRPALNYEKWRNIDKTKIAVDTTKGFMAKKGYKAMTPARYIEFFNTVCSKQGFYELTINWKNGGAHSTLLYRDAKKMLYRIEPQVYMASRGVLCDIKELAAQGSAYPIANVGIARIDNKIFNKDYTSIFDK